jgi:hypothetical protein
VKLKRAEGYKRTAEGGEYVPKNGSWFSSGMRTSGAEFPDMTNVVFIVTEPVVSLAVIRITGAVFASLAGGVPYNVRLGPLRESQLGAFDNV